jgi:hypothetical protein
MTIEELYNKLVEMQIPADKYYLHGLYGSSDDNDKIALTKKGKYSIECETYFKARGEKFSIKILASEDEAANGLLKAIVNEHNFWLARQ